jgi:hypothetical protein
MDSSENLRLLEERQHQQESLFREIGVFFAAIFWVNGISCWKQKVGHPTVRAENWDT